MVLSAILVLVLWQGTGVSALPASSSSSDIKLNKPGGHAIVFSDLKLDDTAAIDHLARSKTYDRVHVVGTGVKSQRAAKGHLNDFLDQQKGINKSKVSYYSGGKDILNQDTRLTHEKNFQGTPTSRVRQSADRDLARRLPKGAKVDVYQIAPTDAKHINRLADNKNIRLQTFHHVAGYNSHQDEQSHKEGTSKKTEDFLTGVHDRVKKTHPNANVIFTTTPDSFTDTGGSTQPVHKLKGRYPANHLDAAKNDPFHQRTLNAAEHIVKPHRDRQLAHGSSEVIPSLHPTKPGRGIDQKTINRARFDEPDAHGKQPTRDHFNRYLDHAEPIVAQSKESNPKLHYRLQTGVRDAFNKSPRLELCDATHVGCVNHARQTGDRTNVRSATFYKDTSGGKSQMKLRPSREGDPQHGHMLVNQTGQHAADILFGKGH